MTRASSSSTLSSVRSRQLATHPDLPFPVLLCPIRTARRVRLRLDERERILKVTHPRAMRPSAALAWAARQKDWVAEQIGRILPAEPFVPGAVIPIDGADLELCWSASAPRTPRLEGARLTCGGPREAFSGRIESFLKRLALAKLSEETAAIAATIGVRPSSVRVGDASTRWGSCSSSGTIRYSWRLILAPPEARRYVVCHEVAHLRHLDHGREFRALEQTLFGGSTAAAEQLLRRTAPRLRRIGLAG